MTIPGPADPTPDSAMDTGSDEGTPGTHLGPGDLSPSEERLLAALERDVGRPETYVPEVRDAEAAGPGAVPAPGPSEPDAGLLPRFEAPGES